MWGDQVGPVVARALRTVESEERRAEREYREAAEGLGEQRRMRSVALFLQQHPEFEDSFRQDMLRGVEPGLTVHERCALEAAEMDRADRAETRLRSERLAQRAEARQVYLLENRIVPRSHSEILAMIAMLP
jgi:hypothetical protein